MASRGIKMVISRSCQFYPTVGESLSNCACACPVGSLITNVTRTMTSKACRTEAPKRQDGQLVTTVKDAKRFIYDCLKAVGTPNKQAEIVAENLVTADHRGHYSHGMNRLEMYIRDIQGGLTNAEAECCVEKENVATALVNGNNGLGACVGKFCMDLAIQKAKVAGIALVVAHSSNHYGIAGMYALQAIEEGFIGMSFTNTSPFMAPTRAKEAALGTNPLSLGAPALEGDSFVLDMATTAVAVGKIELAKRKNKPIPECWAMNNEGKVETDAEVAFNARKLMPLGGDEVNCGYKGYGLGVLVEVFSGMLAGSAYGPSIRKWGVFDEVANLGQGFLAIDPNCFADGFLDRMTDLMSHLRNMEPACSSKPVLVHGDPERIHMEKVKENGGLLYVEDQHDTNTKLAEELKVKPMVSSFCCF